MSRVSTAPVLHLKSKIELMATISAYQLAGVISLEVRRKPPAIGNQPSISIGVRRISVSKYS